MCQQSHDHSRVMKIWCQVLIKSNWLLFVGSFCTKLSLDNVESGCPWGISAIVIKELQQFIRDLSIILFGKYTFYITRLNLSAWVNNKAWNPFIYWSAYCLWIEKNQLSGQLITVLTLGKEEFLLVLFASQLTENGWGRAVKKTWPAVVGSGTRFCSRSRELLLGLAGLRSLHSQHAPKNMCGCRISINCSF